MTVLHVSSAESWRGGEQQVANLIEALNKMGVEQHLACNERGELRKRMHGQCTLIPYKKRNALNLNLAWRLKRLSKHVDLVHVHDSHSHTAAYIAALLGSKTPIIVHRRVDFPIGKSIMSKQKYNHQNISIIICVSDEIKRIVQTSLRAPQKAVTVHSGVDGSRFNQPSNALHNLLRLPSDAVLVGNTSALADHKDYPTFIRSASRLVVKHPNMHFVIFGNGKERENILAHIDALNLHECIHLTGFRNDIFMLLPCLDVFFMPSKTEGLGTSILDAFACNLPVVATRAGGIPEIVIHNQTGLLGEIGDDTSLAAHISSIISNPELSQSLISGAQEHLKNFSIETMSRKILDLYHGIKQGK